MNSKDIEKEFDFKAVRSSGAGGQHVNKVSSKVEVYFNIKESNFLSFEEKNILLNKLSSKLTKQGILKLSCDESRSQHLNKDKVIKRLLNVLSKSLIVEKKRKPTKISASQKRKRLQNKQLQSIKKDLRKKPKLD